MGIGAMIWDRVSQPGFRRTLGFLEMSLGVPREIVIEKINIMDDGGSTHL
jgi:hypothetical protein